MSEIMAGLGFCMAFLGLGAGIGMILWAKHEYGCKHEWEHIADVYPEFGGNMPYARKYCCTKCCKKKVV